jgi:predicted metal-dependent phosphotriesterase family hydrolase
VSATRLDPKAPEAEGRPLVPTLNGAIELGALGRTLVAERIVEGVDGQRYVRGEADADALSGGVRTLFASLEAAGVRTLLDLTPIGYARSPELVQQLAGASAVQVACATGLDLACAPGEILELPATRLAELLIAELTDTLPGVGSAAAAITLAAARGGNALDERLVMAVAFAHAETGAPVILLAGSDQTAQRTGELIGKGVDPENLLVTGLDGASISFAAVDETARHGVQLGLVACGGRATDGLARAAIVAYAIRRYGAERVTLSIAARGEADGASPSRFLELLAGYGVAPETIEAVLTEAPRAVLSPV